jgi:hypothetical protein
MGLEGDLGTCFNASQLMFLKLSPKAYESKRTQTTQTSRFHYTFSRLNDDPILPKNIVIVAGKREAQQGRLLRVCLHSPFTWLAYGLGSRG